jgi:hypothetical protein
VGSEAKIAEGIALLTAALPKGSIGAYQLQAAINAVHDEAARSEDTDYRQTLALYDLPKRMSGNPMVTLNHAIAAAMVHGPSAGLDLLKALDADGRLNGSHRLHAVRAHLLEMAGDRGAGIVLTISIRCASMPSIHSSNSRAIQPAGARKCGLLRPIGLGVAAHLWMRPRSPFPVPPQAHVGSGGRTAGAPAPAKCRRIHVENAGERRREGDDPARNPGWRRRTCNIGRERHATRSSYPGRAPAKTCPQECGYGALRTCATSQRRRRCFSAPRRDCVEKKPHLFPARHSSEPACALKFRTKPDSRPLPSKMKRSLQVSE